jgi:hypothetical protein
MGGNSNATKWFDPVGEGLHSNKYTQWLDPVGTELRKNPSMQMFDPVGKMMGTYGSSSGASPPSMGSINPPHAAQSMNNNSFGGSGQNSSSITDLLNLLRRMKGQGGAA